MLESDDPILGMPGWDRFPPLQIVGQNVSAATAAYRESKGYLVRLARGVYTRSDLTPTERKSLLRSHALRIATHVMRTGVLYGPSAFNRSHHNGVVSLAGGRAPGQMDVGLGLTITSHINDDTWRAMEGVLENIEVEDSLGRFQVKRFTDIYVYLSAFRLRVAGKASIPRITPEMESELARRLLVPRPKQTPESRKDEVLAQIDLLSQQISITVDLKMAKEQIERAFSDSVNKEARAHTLNVFWHQDKVGTLSSDGYSWEFDYSKDMAVKLSLAEDSAGYTMGVPPLLAALLTEHGKSDSQTLDERLDEFRSAFRYTSNINVIEHGRSDVKVVPDVREGQLANFCHEESRTFTGSVARELKEMLIAPRLMLDARSSPELPRISGVQVKLPCYLGTSGHLELAPKRAFTHMLKLVGPSSEYSSMCAMEWFGLSIAKSVGLKVEEFAITDVGLPNPALLVERFDTRQNHNDHRYILAEDFWSISKKNTLKEKFSGDLLDVAQVIREQSTDPGADGTQLLGQAMVSWAMINSDMHLKNLLMLKITDSPEKPFHTVRLSPSYDLMCSHVYPGDPAVAAIKIGNIYGQNHTLGAFIQLGKALNIPEEGVVAMASFIAKRTATTGHNLSLNLPEVIAKHPKSVADIQMATALIDQRCGVMLDEIEAYHQNRSSIVSKDVDEFDPKKLAETRANTLSKQAEEKRMSAVAMSFDAEDFSPPARTSAARRRP